MPPKPSEKRMQHFREMMAYDQAHLGGQCHFLCQSGG